MAVGGADPEGTRRSTSSDEGARAIVFGDSAAPGRAAKNSFASRAITAGSGSAAAKGDTVSRFCAPSGCAGDDVSESASEGSLVLVVLVDIHVLQDPDGIFRQDSDRAVERNKIRGDRLVINSHESNRQTGRNLAWQPRL